MRYEENTGGDGMDFQPENPDVAFEPGTGTQEENRMRDRAVRLKDQAIDRVSTRLESQKSRASETLNGVAQALLLAGEQLRDQDQNGAGPYVERLAHQIERVSSFVQQTDVDEVLDDVGQFARRHPGLFVGGALMLGFVGARFLKSSERNIGAESIDDGYGTARGYASSRGYIGSRDTGYGRHDVSGGTGYDPGERPLNRTPDLGTGSPGFGTTPETGFRAGTQPGPSGYDTADADRTGYGTAG